MKSATGRDQGGFFVDVSITDQESSMIKELVRLLFFGTPADVNASLGYVDTQHATIVDNGHGHKLVENIFADFLDMSIRISCNEYLFIKDYESNPAEIKKCCMYWMELIIEEIKEVEKFYGITRESEPSQDYSFETGV